MFRRRALWFFALSPFKRLSSLQPSSPVGKESAQFTPPLLSRLPSAKMSTDTNDEGTHHGFTTNANDQAEVAKIQARLEVSNSAPIAGEEKQSIRPDLSTIPSVSIDEGAHKYVLVTATEPFLRDGSDSRARRTFVVSKSGAAYHRNAAEPLVDTLQENGFRDIRVLGGGRIFRDDEAKTISIFGYSYGFGKADHAMSKRVVEEDDRYKEYEVTWSNEGY